MEVGRLASPPTSSRHGEVLEAPTEDVKIGIAHAFFSLKITHPLLLQVIRLTRHPVSCFLCLCLLRNRLAAKRPDEPFGEPSGEEKKTGS